MTRSSLAAFYGLEETATAAYPERMERNVRAADGTVVFGDGRSRGSMLTARLCQRHGKPCCMVALGGEVESVAAALRAWLTEHRSRRSTSPAIGPAKRQGSRHL